MKCEEITLEEFNGYPKTEIIFEEEGEYLDEPEPQWKFDKEEKSWVLDEQKRINKEEEYWRAEEADLQNRVSLDEEQERRLWGGIW